MFLRYQPFPPKKTQKHSTTAPQKRLGLLSVSGSKRGKCPFLMQSQGSAGLSRTFLQGFFSFFLFFKVPFASVNEPELTHSQNRCFYFSQQLICKLQRCCLSKRHLSSSRLKLQVYLYPETASLFQLSPFTYSLSLGRNYSRSPSRRLVCLSYVKNLVKSLGLLFDGKKPTLFFFFLDCQNLQLKHPSHPQEAKSSLSH